MIFALCMPRRTSDGSGDFIPPKNEPEAVSGAPSIDGALGYTELYKEGMAYRVSLCGTVTMEGNNAVVYFTNTVGNEKYLKLRVLDGEGRTLGETGLLKPDEYVRCVELTKIPAAGATLRLKVMGYEPSDYSSAGSVVLNVTVADK